MRAIIVIINFMFVLGVNVGAIIPICNPNLVTNPTFTNGNTGFSSELLYAPTHIPLCLNEGYYNVIAANSFCDITCDAVAFLYGDDHSDNTADPNEMFGVFQSQFICDFQCLQEAGGCCIGHTKYAWREVIPNTYPGAQYNFSFWFKAIFDQPSSVNLIFDISINGINVQNFSNNTSSVNNWVQSPNLTWTATSTSATIIITVNSELNGCYYPVGLDDINFNAQCCFPSAQFTADIVPFTTPNTFVDISSSVDPSATVAWDFDNNGTTDLSYIANNPPAMIQYTYSTPGEYLAKLTITNPLGCGNTYYYPAKAFICGNNLVVNGNFEFGNVGFTTQHAYSVICPLPQEYTITNDASSCTNVTCTYTGQDHTSGNGKFGLFGGFNPVLKLWEETINGIEIGTNHQFSMWIANPNIGYAMNVTAFIYINDNQVFTQLYTLAPSQVWQEVNFVWLSDNANVKITVKLVLSQGITCNPEQISIDDISFKSTKKCAPYCVPCVNCEGLFSPEPGKQYVLSAWAKETNNNPAAPYLTNYTNPAIEIIYYNNSSTIGSDQIIPSGTIIEGWQRIEGVFTIPATPTMTDEIEVKLKNLSTDPLVDVYFDDIRIHPFDANMKSFVYDPKTLRLAAELDENNYATFYEYSEEGALIRVKKETERGVYTIQESRSNTHKPQ